MRMTFTQKDCETVFGLKVSCEPQPQFSVSRGLARLGRVELRSRNFLKGIDEYINLPDFRNAISEQVPRSTTRSRIRSPTASSRK